MINIFARREQQSTLTIWILFLAIPLAFLEAVSLLFGETFIWLAVLKHLSFTGGIIVSSYLSQPYLEERRTWILPWTGILIAVMGLVSGYLYITIGATWAAWVMLAVFYTILLWFNKVFVFQKGIWIKLAVNGTVALVVGLTSVATAQIEAQFAEEEFFAAVQVIILSIYWFLLTTVWSRASQEITIPIGNLPGFRFTIYPLAASLPCLAIIGLIFTLYKYQQSFFPKTAPDYEGITAETPFLCTDIPGDTYTYNGEDIQERILALVESNPAKQSPEFALLSLTSEDEYWKDEYKNSLLREAEDGLFTKPAHSVKYGQYEASLRIYYYMQMKAAFPDIFTPEEDQALTNWFASINQRSQTVEWVDWLYGLAFSKWPEGPYENQEVGAGLLSLLEWGELGDPAKSNINRDYLAGNPRGWLERFRNTDDAIVYQPEWIYNAFFQGLYSNEIRQDHLQQSFVWLLLQALPDGYPVRYNHIGGANLAGISYLGASMLNDEQYIWLAGRSLDYMENKEILLTAKPGMELSVRGDGKSPTQGSCLLYGNSGLPNQNGPLAPDKIVFRDGWSTDSTYLLVNLRFTGWHRYKATNTITILHQAGPLVIDQYSDDTFSWLPSGRNLFRDKRIPRENLNGLVVSRTGMSAVIYELTRMSSPWAQDPPHYARVEDFEVDPEIGLDTSRTIIDNWRGWNHTRTIYFYHNGPIVIVDNANGPDGQKAALTWHINGVSQPQQNNRISIRNTDPPAEMLMIPLGTGTVITEAIIKQKDPLVEIQYHPSKRAQLNLITIFLLDKWNGADVELIYKETELVLQVSKDKESVKLKLPLIDEGD